MIGFGRGLCDDACDDADSLAAAAVKSSPPPKRMRAGAAGVDAGAPGSDLEPKSLDVCGFFAPAVPTGHATVSSSAESKWRSRNGNNFGGG